METTPCARGKAFQHEKDIKRDYEKKDISENDIRGNNLKTNVETIRMFEPFNRSKNLIVNPLPAVQPYPQVSVPEHNLLPAVNKSTGPGVNCIYGDEDELGSPEPIHPETANKRRLRKMPWPWPPPLLLLKMSKHTIKVYSYPKLIQLFMVRAQKT